MAASGSSRSARSTPPRAKGGAEGKAKGDDLERRVGRVEFSDGALVRLRWPVLSPGDVGRTITDVDVLSIDFDSRLRAHVSVCECKSVRGTSGEADRLVWLAGLQRLVGADRSALVRESVTAGGREVARALGVDLLGGVELDRREGPRGWVPDSFGMVGGKAWADFDAVATSQIKALGDYSPRLLASLRHASLLWEPHRALGVVATVCDAASRGATLPPNAGVALAGHSMVTLVLAAVRCAGRLDALGMDGVRREVEDGLRTGDPTDRQLLRVVAVADALLRDQASRLHERYVAAGARPVDWTVPSLSDEVNRPLPWLPRFFDFADRLRARPDLARELPQTVDLAVFDALVGGSAWMSPAFDHLFTVEHRQLLLVALDVLRLAGGDLAEHLEAVRGLAFDRAPHVVADRVTVPGPGSRFQFTRPAPDRNQFVMDIGLHGSSDGDSAPAPAATPPNTGGSDGDAAPAPAATPPYTGGSDGDSAPPGPARRRTTTPLNRVADGKPVEWAVAPLLILAAEVSLGPVTADDGLQVGPEAREALLGAVAGGRLETVLGEVVAAVPMTGARPDPTGGPRGAAIGRPPTGWTVPPGSWQTTARAAIGLGGDASAGAAALVDVALPAVAGTAAVKIRVVVGLNPGAALPLADLARLLVGMLDTCARAVPGVLAPVLQTRAAVSRVEVGWASPDSDGNGLNRPVPAWARPDTTPLGQQSGDRAYQGSYAELCEGPPDALEVVLAGMYTVALDCGYLDPRAAVGAVRDELRP